MKQLKCPNCGEENSFLNQKCKNCGGFLQQRVPNLNLFETIIEVLEKPSFTFHKICLSEQKNYIFFLFSFAGFSLLFTLYSITSFGRLYSNLLYLLLPSLVFGPLLGIINFSLFSYFSFFITQRILKGESSLRNIRAILAYSLTPIVLATIFVLPTELIIFGMYLFTNVPPPSIYKPVPFYILVSLDILSVIYSIFLFYKGLSIANNFNSLKSFLGLIILMIIFAAMFYLQILVLYSFF